MKTKRVLSFLRQRMADHLALRAQLEDEYLRADSRAVEAVLQDHLRNLAVMISEDTAILGKLGVLVDRQEKRKTRKRRNKWLVRRAQVRDMNWDTAEAEPLNPDVLEDAEGGEEDEI